VKGVLSIALEARRRNRRTLIVPLHNAPEAAVVEGVDVYGATSLSEVVEFLRGQKVLETLPYCKRGNKQRMLCPPAAATSTARFT